MNELTIGSLFSGIGGVELGFERAGGFRTIWFVEYEPYAQAVLKKHWPEAVIYGDITQLDFKSVPKPDILTGGFPCQDISNAGKRAGIEGSRSSLWKYYLEAIRTIRPKFALIENVSALLDRGLSVVLADLASVGYDAEWHCISASSVGALHRRDRIFILAYPNSCGHFHSELEEHSTERRIDALSKSIASGQDVANSNSERSGQGFEKLPTAGQRQAKDQEWKCGGNAQSGSQDVSNANCWRLEGTEESRRDEWDAFRSGDNGRWAIEPELGRVAHGIPNRIHRIKCLGNAVVPQCAEVFARAIKTKT